MAPNSWWKICNGDGKDLKTDQNVVTVTINGRGCVMMSHWCKSNKCVEHKWTTTLAIYVKKVITHTYTWEMKERERAGNRDHGTSSPRCCWALTEWGRGPRPLGWIFVPYSPPHLLKSILHQVLDRNWVNCWGTWENWVSPTWHSTCVSVCASGETRRVWKGRRDYA